MTSIHIPIMQRPKVYAAAGIREYWVINLKTRELNVFRNPINGEYQSQIVLTNGVISPLAFPNIRLDIARVLQP
jgi:Uma2 family endonuclease